MSGRQSSGCVAAVLDLFSRRVVGRSIMSTLADLNAVFRQ
jgi:hypothetical protein